MTNVSIYNCDYLELHYKLLIYILYKDYLELVQPKRKKESKKEVKKKEMGELMWTMDYIGLYAQLVFFSCSL